MNKVDAYVILGLHGSSMSVLHEVHRWKLFHSCVRNLIAAKLVQLRCHMVLVNANRQGIAGCPENSFECRLLRH